MFDKWNLSCLVCGLLCVACSPAMARGVDQSASSEPDSRTATASAAPPEQQSDAFKNLAARLIDAPTDAERGVLLQANSNLVSASLESALAELAGVCRTRGEFAKAQTGFQWMREIATRSGHPAAVADALRELGVNSRLQLSYAEALDYFQKSLDIAESLGDQRLIALALLGMGVPHAQQGDLAQAADIFNRALRIATAIDDQALVAKALVSVGITQRQLGSIDAALDSYQRALAIFEAENPVPTAEIAKLLLNLGALYAATGDNGRALQHYLRSLVLFGADGDATLRAILLNDIAWAYDSRREHAQALDYAHRALALAKRIGNKGEIADAYNAMAQAQANQGRYAQSLETYQKSLALQQQIADRRQTADVLMRIGGVQLRQRRYGDAATALQQALNIGESIGTPDITAQAGVTLANVRFKQGRFDESLALAQQSAELAGKHKAREVLWSSRAMEGRAYRALGRTTQAQEAFGAAIATIEELRSQVAGGPGSHSGYFESAVAPYQEMVGLLVAHKQFADALEYAERAKGRVLLDVLVGGRVNVTKAMTPVEREREQQFESELASLNRQIQMQPAQSATHGPPSADLHGQLEKTRVAYQNFQDELYGRHPELKVRRGEAQPLTMGEAARLLPDARSALLEYVVAEENSYLLVLTRRTGSDEADITAYTIEVAASDLRRRARKFRQQLAERNLDFRASAAALFKLLLEPARQQLAGKTALIIVPDGSLWDLPFQALLENGKRYLVENHAIAYAPSATVLREMTRLHAQNREGKSASGPSTLLAMADPELGGAGGHQSDGDGQTHIMLAYRGERLEALPEARREVAALQELYGSGQSEVYTGIDARESRFKAEAGKFRILHLATHGILDDANPMYSSVLLSQQDDGKEDGLLEAREIMQMDLKADLVVLSACETARGRISAGEGVIGLTWALFVAGTPTSVVSQWKVESASTAALMLTFHRALKAGSGSVFSTMRALQRAEVRMLHSQRYAHPFYWAGFVVVGDPN